VLFKSKSPAVDCSEILLHIAWPADGDGNHLELVAAGPILRWQPPCLAVQIMRYQLRPTLGNVGVPAPLTSVLRPEARPKRV
jgi:hypothetical protein